MSMKNSNDTIGNRSSDLPACSTELQPTTAYTCIHIYYIYILYICVCGPGSSVGIATDYELDGPGSNPGGGRDCTPVQTGPGAHPVSCKMGTGSFPGVEAARTWG